MSNKLHLYVDASSLAHSKCVLDWYYTVVQGYCEPRPAAAMQYGTAVHKFIDTCYKTNGNLIEAHAAAQKAFLVPKLDNRKQPYLSDVTHLQITCNNLYFGKLKEDDDFQVVKLPSGLPATEVTFSIPFYEDETIQVNLSGTIDKIGKFKNGIWAVGDWKTSSTHNPEVHLDSYTMSAQLRTYTLACKLMTRMYPDSLLGKIGAERMGAFIDGIYLRSKPNDNEVVRSEVFKFEEKDILEFEKVLLEKIAAFSKAIRENNLPREGIINGACQKGFGKCAYWVVCKTAQPHIRELLLKRDFVQRPYNPLNFGGTAE